MSKDDLNFAVLPQPSFVSTSKKEDLMVNIRNYMDHHSRFYDLLENQYRDISLTCSKQAFLHVSAAMLYAQVYHNRDAVKYPKPPARQRAPEMATGRSVPKLTAYWLRTITVKREEDIGRTYYPFLPFAKSPEPWEESDKVHPMDPILIDQGHYLWRQSYEAYLASKAKVSQNKAVVSLISGMFSGETVAQPDDEGYSKAILEAKKLSDRRNNVIEKTKVLIESLSEACSTILETEGVDETQLKTAEAIKKIADESLALIPAEWSEWKPANYNDSIKRLATFPNVVPEIYRPIPDPVRMPQPEDKKKVKSALLNMLTTGVHPPRVGAAPVGIHDDAFISGHGSNLCLCQSMIDEYDLFVSKYSTVIGSYSMSAVNRPTAPMCSPWTYMHVTEHGASARVSARCVAGVSAYDVTIRVLLDPMGSTTFARAQQIHVTGEYENLDSLRHDFLLRFVSANKPNIGARLTPKMDWLAAVRNGPRPQQEVPKTVDTDPVADETPKYQKGNHNNNNRNKNNNNNKDKPSHGGKQNPNAGKDPAKGKGKEDRPKQQNKKEDQNKQ